MFKHNINLTKIGSYTAYLYCENNNSYYTTDFDYFYVIKEREARIEVYKEGGLDHCCVGKGDNLIINEFENAIKELSINSKHQNRFSNTNK